MELSTQALPFTLVRTSISRNGMMWDYKTVYPPRVYSMQPQHYGVCVGEVVQRARGTIPGCRQPGEVRSILDDMNIDPTITTVGEKYHAAVWGWIHGIHDERRMWNILSAKQCTLK